MPFSCGNFRAQKSWSLGQWICVSFVRDRRARASKLLVVSAKAYLQVYDDQSTYESERDHSTYLICFQHS